MKYRHQLSEEEISQETWKPIQGYENIYEISNMGRVRRLISYRAKKPRILNGSVCNIYPFVTLSINDVHDRRPVHRIVAEHFLSNPENKPFVNHIDANSFNNRLSNLEWCTQQENIRHAHNIGNMGGLKHAANRFTETDILTIRLLYGWGSTLYDISKMFKRSSTIIKGIVLGKSYKHVIGSYSGLRSSDSF